MLAVCWPRLAVVVDSLSEVLTLLRYDYQRLLVLVESANLLALRRDVKLLKGTVAHSLSVEKSREESKDARTRSDIFVYNFFLPFLLSFILFLFHDRSVGRLLRIRLVRCICHVDSKHVDGVVVRGRCDEPRSAAELEVIDFCFVCSAAEHEWAGWIRCVHLPDANQSSLLAGSGQKIALFVEGHGRDGALMASNDGLDSFLGKGSHLHVALLSVGDRQSAAALAVQGAQAVGIVAGIEAVDQGQVGEVVYVSLHCENDHHSAQRNKVPRSEDIGNSGLLTHPCAI